MRRVWGVVGLAIWACTAWSSDAQMAVTDPSAEEACFEVPIVILAPVDKPFPKKGCVQAPFPSESCMKERIVTQIEVIDNTAANGSLARNCLTDKPTNTYRSVAHYRGQSSLGFRKHQFTVKLNDASPFLGFPEERSFVLNGPLIDGSLIRNHLAHWLFRVTGRYSPRTRHIIVFTRSVDSDNLEYLGVYLALEKIAYGPNRVGLAELNNQCTTQEYSGGWAWQLNPLNFGVYSPNIIQDQYDLMFGAGERPVLMYPPREALTQSMRDYFVNTTTGPLPQLYRYLYERADQPDELEEHIDLGSFVDYMLHSELSQNTDAYRRSTYFFKDRDQPINAGPVWDFNLAYGTGMNSADWLFKPHLLWKRLLCNYKFVSLTIKRWRQLRATVWSDKAIEAFIDESTAPFTRQFANCFHWYNRDMPCANVKVHGKYEGQVNRVKVTIEARAKWMDENVVKLYGKIDKAFWALANKLPTYNCAADGNDGGCLTDPEKYINAVEMKPPHQPYTGKKCSNPAPSEQPSIDPCWLSSGTYITHGSLTNFCSGFGYCPPGPGAKCKCIHGKSPPTCGNITVPEPDVVQLNSAEGNDAIHKNETARTWGTAGYLVVLICGIIVALIIAHLRRHPSTKAERAPIVAERGESARVSRASYGTQAL